MIKEENSPKRIGGKEKDMQYDILNKENTKTTLHFILRMFGFISYLLWIYKIKYLWISINQMMNKLIIYKRKKKLGNNSRGEEVLERI